MRLLLDTHVLLWALADDPNLLADARRAIIDAENDVLVSAASVWEISIKQSLGKLRAPLDLEREIELGGLQPLPISLSHAYSAGNLPHHHQDPFDRMLVAQALAENLTLVTRDERLSMYGISMMAA